MYRLAVVIAVLFVLVLPARPVGIGAVEVRASVSIDWPVVLSVGIRVRANRPLGFQASLGANTLLIAGSLNGLVFLRAPEHPWQVNILFGVPCASVPLSFDGGMLSLGGSIGFSYRFPSQRALELRGGGGFPLFFEAGKPFVRDIRFWPDLSIGMSFPLGRSQVDSQTSTVADPG